MCVSSIYTYISQRCIGLDPAVISPRFTRRQELLSRFVHRQSTVVAVNSMPTAPVNDTGAVVYYEDSGAPGNIPIYVTFVIIHGLAFHGGTCQDCMQRALESHASEHFCSEFHADGLVCGIA